MTHARKNSAHEKNGWQHIGIECRIPFLGPPIEEFARRWAGIIVDQNVGIGTGGNELVAPAGRVPGVTDASGSVAAANPLFELAKLVASAVIGMLVHFLLGA